jgi:shikimate dehydrogenase
VTADKREQWLRVGVIGDPVAHSISPAMHQPALDALGIPAIYERWHTSAAELPDRVASLRLPDALGASVTVPHKLAVMSLLDEVSELARRAGAVNTIVNRGGALFGDNTDVYGFATSLAEACADLERRTALVLGAGGAARAVVQALESLGVPSIRLHNRSAERAEQLARDLATIPIDLVTDSGFSDALQTSRLLVNATALGWHAGERPIDLEMLSRCREGTLVADLTYRDTDLLRAARERGLPTLDGLPMLLHQGARAFGLWTGKQAPLEVMMAAAERERERRA